MKLSSIGWTDYSSGDANFVTGCTPVSESCENCYAREIYNRFGRDFGTVTVHPEKLERLWRARFPEWSPKRGVGHRPMVFVCDTGDLFHPDVPDDFLEFVFHTMGHLSGVVWQVLTKRPERMRDFLTRFNFEDLPSDHIWLGVTAENQARADERIPILLDTPAAVRFVSVEPMLGPVNLAAFLFDESRLDWVICGAESGPHRRLFFREWAERVWRQCAAAGIPFFGKQDSGLRPGAPLLIYGQEVYGWPDGRRA